MNAESLWTRVSFVAVTISVMAAYVYFAFRTVFIGPEMTVGLKSLKEPEKHVATDAMIRSADAITASLAPRFSAEDGMGVVHDCDSVRSPSPTILIFIKNGCPCSVAAQPFFERIAAAFADKARFLGIIDGTPETARAWGEKYRAKMPILADPKLKIVRDYGAENSVYVTLIGPDRRIVRAWPGHSEEMLKELVVLIENMTGHKVEGLNFAEAPGTLMGSCPFDL